jgi:hypothetical protein
MEGQVIIRARENAYGVTKPRSDNNAGLGATKIIHIEFFLIMRFSRGV